MKKLIFLVILNILLFLSVSGQGIKGHVYGIDNNNKKPLPFASVYWKGSQVFVSTDENGAFLIENPVNTNKLIANMVGYISDTIEVNSDKSNGLTPIIFELQNTTNLNEVNVYDNSNGSYHSKMNTIHTQKITSEGLKKLACCNLSESFENNASVDVSYSDAVTGAKQIQLLGLSGSYSQLLTENMPINRGLSSIFGLQYIPGTWMESIQISKGTSSVINGYESITGQINIEYRKPPKSEILHLNLYGNHNGRYEANAYSAKNFSEELGTMLFVHHSGLQNKVDDNDDHFLDTPIGNQTNILNRWMILPRGLFEIQLSLRYLNETRIGGQVDFNEEVDRGLSNRYGSQINSEKLEFYGKVGIPFSREATSIGIQFSASNHNQKGFFGLTNYAGKQLSFHTNAIFQTYVFNTNHTLKAGFSYQADKYSESLSLMNLDRTEMVPGVFSEYTYIIADKLSAIAGIRYDAPENEKAFFTPRLHVKYNLTEESILRFSIGKGYRSAQVIAENIAILSSSKIIVFEEKLKYEEATNYGVNFYQCFDITEKKEIVLNLDFYRTDFIQQTIVDMDRDLQNIYVYNLNGKSYSNSFQGELNFKLIERLDFTTAFRYNDVKITTNDILQDKPLVNKYRGILTLSYSTNHNKWKFDFTNQFNGASRLPEINGNTYRTEIRSKPYYILHAQVTKKFKHFDLYLGAENLTNFTQNNPVIAAENPFSEYFDSSIVWGPIVGRMFYIGARYSLK